MMDTLSFQNASTAIIRTKHLLTARKTDIFTTVLISRRQFTESTTSPAAENSAFRLEDIKMRAPTQSRLKPPSAAEKQRIMT